MAQNNNKTSANKHSIINESVIRKGGTKPQPSNVKKPDVKPEPQKKTLKNYLKS